MAVTAQAGPVAAIGNFDGVHLGHQYLIAETVKLAAEAGAPAGVIVFEPHPRRFFRPQDPPFLLTTSPERTRLLKSYGASEIFTLIFDEAMAALTPEAFVRSVLHEQLGLSGVVTGTEFQFGRARAGDVTMLADLCADVGIAAHRVTPMTNEGAPEKIGSSVVRAALQEGDVRRAEALLGRRWSVEGVVAPGQKLGRTIGFPTANITLGDLVEPRYGVYAVMITVDGVDTPGVANFGRRPTVGAPAPLLEAHLFDFDGDLYGKTIRVAFADFIRAERKFDGIDGLKAQIARDCETARRLLAA
ncbi:MAG: bifunctional riboflavin kinase/FAD synthetase [Pseudomonadota bacterium]